MRIRMANAHELPRIIAIEKACFPVSEAASATSLTQRFNTFQENFLVALDKEEVVGFINGCTYHEASLPDVLYEDVSLHDANVAYMMVFGLNVVSTHRRQGIAKQLLEAYIQLAKQRNKKGVVLTCKDHLKEFYESVGFIDEGVSASTHGGVSWNDMVLYF